MDKHFKPGIGANLNHFSDMNPEKIAIYYKNKEITYQTFTQNIAFYQHLLKDKLPTQKNHKVALLLINEPIFLEVYFAVIMLGWTAVPFDPKWTVSEAKYIKALADPDLILTNESFKQVATYEFQEAILIDVIPSNQNNKLIIADASDDFYLGFTSGSTGFPKGFTRNQNSWLKSFEAGEAVFNYDSTDTLMAPGPLNHSLSLFGATHALHIGASFCLTTSFSAPLVFDLIHKHNVTVMYGIPTMLHSLALLELNYQQPVKFLSSGAKLQPEVKNRLRDVFPQANIYEYYGASELSYVTYATDSFNKNYPESVGHPFPSVKLTIRDQEKNILPTNSIGSIYIESDFLFSSYVKNDPATKETLTEYGAFIGDVGFINDIGALMVVGRKNNMIIIGGQNVYPEEVEKVIKQATSVKEAIITSEKDTHWGERIIAKIQWHNRPNLKEVRQLCKDQLSVYKRPRKYVTVANFPYTHTGKIARNKDKEGI